MALRHSRHGTALRIGFRFTLGGATALLGLSLLPALIFGGLHGFFSVPEPCLSALLRLGQMGIFFLDGAVGGASLGLGMRGTLSFGIGFVALGFFALEIFSFIRFLPGEIAALPALFYSMALFAVGFGLAGGVGTRLSGRPTAVAWRASRSFALGGILGGILIIGPFLLSRTLPLDPVEPLCTLLGAVGGFLVPHFLGGSVLGGLIADLGVSGAAGGEVPMTGIE